MFCLGIIFGLMADMYTGRSYIFTYHSCYGEQLTREVVLSNDFRMTKMIVTNKLQILQI